MQDSKTNPLARVDVADYHSARRPAVNVKDRAWHGSLAAELDMPDEVGNALWDELRDSFWEMAAPELVEDHFGSGVRFYSEGRSGGWLAVDLGYDVELDELEAPDPEDFTSDHGGYAGSAEALEDAREDYMIALERQARFLDFARDARREADYYSTELMEERMREWAEERDEQHEAGRGDQ